MLLKITNIGKYIILNDIKTMTNNNDSYHTTLNNLRLYNNYVNHS